MRAISWRVAGDCLDLTNRALLMGVLNVTPDSFSDGGDFFAAEAAVRHGLKLAQSGADIIDIGGESTRPGAQAVAPNDELERVLPVVQQLARSLRIHLSIDTSKASVARAALKAGAVVINDVTGGNGDPEMFRVAAETGAAMVIMHMQGTPRTMQQNPVYKDVVAEVAEFFQAQFDRAVKAGIDPTCLAFDPGIGFGKTSEHNLQLLANLSRLRVENRPLVVGVSRKSFLAKLTDAPNETESATVALTSLLRERGAQILRVHDVAANAAALRATEAILAVGS